MQGLIRISLFILLVISNCFVYNNAHDEEADVLILGAGVAGIFAAAKLKENGIDNVIVLEGTDRMGGRMKSADIGGYTVELGCLWIHGNTLMKPLADLYGLQYEVDDEAWTVFDVNGNNVTDEADDVYETYYEAFDQTYPYAQTLLENRWPDISIRGMLRWNGFTPRSTVERVVELMEFDFFYAIGPDSTTTKHRQDNHFVYGEEDVDYMVTQQENGGYVHVLRSYADEHLPDWESSIHFNTTVTGIEYTNDAVIVQTSQGHTYTAKYAINTFSLGVMQHSDIVFNPPLPQWKQQAIQGFQFNHYTHFYLQFPANTDWSVVPETEYILYAGENVGFYSLWENWNIYQPNSNILQGSVLDGEAIRIDNLSDAEIVAEVMPILRIMFGSNFPEPINVVIPRWSSDPFYFGAYSNWPVGYTKSLHDSLKAPMKRLHFAGEAYSYEYWGFLQGAMATGIETAELISKCLNTSPGSSHEECDTDFQPSFLARGCTYREALNYDENAKEDDGSCMLLEYPPTPASGSKTSITHASTLFMLAYVGLKYLYN